jgi:hypothetical protein
LREGLHPFNPSLGIKLDHNPDGSATTYSPCIRCDAFDGFPCAINAKANAQVICVDPTRALHENFTLLTNAYVTGRKPTCRAAALAVCMSSATYMCHYMSTVMALRVAGGPQQRRRETRRAARHDAKSNVIPEVPMSFR